MTSINCANSMMKCIIVAGWIFAAVDGIGIILKDNGTKCNINCPLEQNKTFSYDSTCKQYVECMSFGFVIWTCWGDSKFDEETEKCVPKNETETPVCHPCAGHPPYIRTMSDCPIDCHANKGKNISHSIDCKMYVACTDETLVTFRGCPDDQTFSDAAGKCVEPPEGSGPTCHPCRSSKMPLALGYSSGVNVKVDLATKIILIFIATIIVV